MAKQMDVEQQILGAILFDYGSCGYAFERLLPVHFINKQHSQFYEEIIELRNQGKDLDLVTIGNQTKFYDLALSCSTSVYTAANIRSHVDICLDRYYLAVTRQMLIEAVKSLEEIDRSPSKLRKRIEDMAFFLADRAQDRGLQHISEISQPTIHQLNEIQQGNFPGVKTGFSKLDDMGFYFRRKTITVLAARPGMGKSALALKIAKNCKENVAFYSMEMANEEQYERLISMKTALTNDDLRSKSTLESQGDRIVTAAAEINEHPIWMNDSTRVTIPMILNQCKRLKARKGLGLIIVDYMGLVKTGGKFGSRREEVGYISKGLKNVANELDVPVLALSQLNRSCEERHDKRPILADLRESGDIEQDAHMVWFLYRPEVYDPKDNPGKAEIIIRKNRSGLTGSTPLTYHKGSTDFVDYEPVADAFNADDWIA